MTPDFVDLCVKMVANHLKQILPKDIPHIRSPLPDNSAKHK